MCQQDLKDQLTAWERKASLRFLYNKWFAEIRHWLRSGLVLELGCGIGRLKESIPGTVTVDIEKTPWTDIVGDAQRLPFGNGSIKNMVLFDVLHHLPRPVLLFKEAERVLQSGGRLVIVEPYISTLSKFVYDRFHPEPVVMHCDPFDTDIPLSSDRPFDSNQAIATLFFFNHFRQWQETFPNLSIITKERFAFFAYPATGGFGNREFLPTTLIQLLDKAECVIKPMSALFAFRMLVVLEKKAESAVKN